jgi:flagellar hook protein FlgE
MSIYGAMFSGISGLAAQSQALGMISDNISNVNTVGYKHTTATFHTLVTTAASTTHYSPGGVRSRPFQHVDRQGLLQGSSSPTDIAIVGNGFFIVNEAATPGVGDNYLFTRAGNFSMDRQGNLVSNSGYYLQGWRLDADGNLPANTNLLNSLETVNVSNLTGSARATSRIELAMNLPAQDPVNSTHNFEVQIFDKQGKRQEMSLTWVKTANNTWALIAGLPGDGAFATDDTTGAALLEGTTNFFPSATLANTTQFSLDSAAGDISGPVGAFDASTTPGTITVTIGGITYTATPGTDGTPAADVGTGDTLTFTDGGGRTFTLNVNGATTYDLDDPAGQAALEADLNSAFTGVAFNNGAVNGLQIATVTFNANGTIGSVVGVAPAAINAGSQLEFYVDYDNDPLTTSTQDRQLITLDLGTPGIDDGLTQYESEFFPSKIDQDGLSFGAFIGITINENGIVTALFDNGQRRDIFKLPIATFRNPNGLQAVNGNAYLETIYSGNVLLQQANTGGAGAVAPSSLEASTVDLAEQFTNMIITQRAYSASAKIITTSDEMLEELVRIAQ